MTKMRSQPRSTNAARRDAIDGVRVSHRPVDDDVLAEWLEQVGELLGLRAGDGLDRRFVPLTIPDFPVVAHFAPRAERQNDAVENDLPQQRILFDHARIGEEFLEIAPHRRGIGGIRRAEIDQKHADARSPARLSPAAAAASAHRSFAERRRQRRRFRLARQGRTAQARQAGVVRDFGMVRHGTGHLNNATAASAAILACAPRTPARKRF